MNKQEFIAELSDKLNEVGEISQWHSGYKKGLYDALVLTRKLEEPEKPLIPQYVADWIEICKERADLVSCLEGYFQYGQGGFKTETIKEHEDWLFEHDHADLVTRAWLDGYTVKKEKLYRVALIKGKYLIYNRINKQLHNQELDAYVGDHEQREFTEQEIKAIDERYWVFAEEVTE